MTEKGDVFIHPTADVDARARIDAGTMIWNWAQVRERASVGRDCILSKGVYVDVDVTVGNAVKIQNNASLYSGVVVEDGVFIGPHVTFTNDRCPRAVTPEMAPIREDGWKISPTLVRRGASIGAGSVIVAGVTLGQWCLVGAGCVVTRNVPDYAVVTGTPARVVGWIAPDGTRLSEPP